MIILLEKHIGLLSDYLMYPLLSTHKRRSFRLFIEQLVESLHKYKIYLASHNDHMKEVCKRTTVQPSD